MFIYLGAVQQPGRPCMTWLSSGRSAVELQSYASPTTVKSQSIRSRIVVVTTTQPFRQMFLRTIQTARSPIFRNFCSQQSTVNLYLKTDYCLINTTKRYARLYGSGSVRFIALIVRFKQRSCMDQIMHGRRLLAQTSIQQTQTQLYNSL